VPHATFDRVKTVIRYDRAALRKPRMTPQGFLRVDGHVARAGIYEYRNDDGSTRYELRPKEEVHDPESLASYDTAPMTIDHPVDEMVTADNVRRHEVGSVTGDATPDGDHVAASMVIKDAKAIKLARSGKHQLSPGYKIELDETPGSDRRYAYSSNPTGRYHAVQRKIRVNHVALVDHARGGTSIRLRMDAADRVDSSGKLTSSVNGHQHLVDCHGWDGFPRSSGETSYAVTEGADQGHSHPWVKDATGAITIGESDGHTHTLLDGTGAYDLPPIPTPLPRADTQFDQSGAPYESHRMDKDEQIRSLKEQLAAAEAKLAPANAAIAAAATRADSAEATIKTLHAESAELRAQIAAAAQVVETEAIRREKIRADSAEAELRGRDALFDTALQARVELERLAAVVMPDLNMRGLRDRDIVATVVKRLDAQQATDSSISDAYLRGRFDSLIDLHRRNARSLQRVADVIVKDNEQRADSLEEKRQARRNQWQEPLPNSREAQSARGRT
jgi:hypothetical protein